jgi:hypothetical protein
MANEATSVGVFNLLTTLRRQLFAFIDIQTRFVGDEALLSFGFAGI